jgi:hypothetical protein
VVGRGFSGPRPGDFLGFLPFFCGFPRVFSGFSAFPAVAYVVFTGVSAAFVDILSSGVASMLREDICFLLLKRSSSYTPQVQKIWTYLYSTADSPLDTANDEDIEAGGGPAVLAGYGYGLPYVEKKNIENFSYRGFHWSFGCFRL